MTPRIKFDELITLSDWSDALGRILDAALKATEKRDAPGRQELMDQLLIYIKRSPAVAEVFDVIAREAIEDLAITEINDSLNRLTSRSAELTRAGGLIDAVTAEARKDAKTLQLESTLDALAKAKVAIDALKKVEQALDKPDDGLLKELAVVATAVTTAAKRLSK